MKDFCVNLKNVVLLWVLTGPAVFATQFGHDLCSYEIVEPSPDYVEDGVTITPTLGIANLGDHGESNVWFKFYTVDVASGDTTFEDSATLGFIGAYPDYAIVEFSDWTPEGRCAKIAGGGPFVELELIGILCFTSDQDRSNDTARANVTVLLTHDVGVIDQIGEPGPGYPPDRYKVGDTIIFTATVENFGYNTEYDVPVKPEIVDKTADPDTLVWQNIQPIQTLPWRCDTAGETYTADVVFPRFIVPSLNWLSNTCKTELVGDLCPDDDIGPIPYIPPPPPDTYAVKEKAPEAEGYSLEATGSAKGGAVVSFTIPQGFRVRIDIYDATGRYVRSLLDTSCKAGSQNMLWDGCDYTGLKCPRGVYEIRMQAEGFTTSKKVVVFN